MELSLGERSNERRKAGGEQEGNVCKGTDRIAGEREKVRCEAPTKQRIRLTVPQPTGRWFKSRMYTP